jgi:hypothetical protein
MDRTTQGPPNCQDAPWAHSSRPCHTLFSTSLPIRVYPGLNSVTSFAVERNLFGQLNVRHAFNMTRGMSNDRSLIDIDRITIVQNPIRLRPVSVYPSTLGYMITIIANHNQVSTYISQVIKNHPTSTGLNMAKQYF